MKEVINFLEQNIDIFEKVLAERYFQKQNAKHDIIYFVVQSKFDSFHNSEVTESYIVLCQTDQYHTAINTSFKLGSFEVFEVAKDEYPHMLVRKLEKRIEEINKYLENESVH